MSNQFLETYVKSREEDKGIPGIEMNAPYIPQNAKKDVGIELEMEGRGLLSQAKIMDIQTEKGIIWVTKADHSLRNGGVEYVLQHPIDVSDVEKMVSGLYQKMAKNKSVLQPSNRCSTHVHINVGGKKINQLTSVIALWTTFEEALINYCGEERVTNHFCLSGKETNRLINNWSELLRDGSTDWTEGMKYSALNMRPMHDFGSIEFRTMRMDKNPQPIIDWCTFIHGMCQFAFRRYENPMMLAADLSELGGEGLFHRIVGECEHTSGKFLDEVISQSSNHTFNQMALEGFRRAQPIVMGYPWHDWLPLIQAEYVPSPFAKRKEPGKRRRGLRIEAIEAPRFEPPRGLRIDRDRPVDIREAPIPHQASRIDPDEAIEFPDGTPFFIDEIDEPNGRIKGRALSDGTIAWFNDEHRRSRWYLLRDGLYSGAGFGHPWIRNRVAQAVPAEPFPEPVRREDPALLGDDIRRVMDEARARIVQRAEDAARQEIEHRERQEREAAFLRGIQQWPRGNED